MARELRALHGEFGRGISPNVTSHGFVVGGGVRLKLAGTPVRLQGEVDDYHYAVSLNLPAYYGAQSPEIQSDLVASVSLALPVGWLARQVFEMW
jgi:hypothetical protein